MWNEKRSSETSPVILRERRPNAAVVGGEVLMLSGAIPNLTSPVILRERRTESQSDSVGEGSASIAPRELPSNSLSFLFPLPLSGEGQGEGHLCGAIVWCATHLMRDEISKTKKPGIRTLTRRVERVGLSLSGRGY